MIIGLGKELIKHFIPMYPVSAADTGYLQLSVYKRTIPHLNSEPYTGTHL